MKRESVERGELKNPTRFADSLCRSMCRKIVPMLQALLLRCAAKALRDNEPSGSHPCFHAKKATLTGCFLRKDRDSFFAALRKRYAITNPRVLIPAFTQKKQPWRAAFLRKDRDSFFAALRKRCAITNPRVLIPAFTQKKQPWRAAFLRKDRDSNPGYP